jgi:drug/metabolite transporter (DMT)-like permease
MSTELALAFALVASFGYGISKFLIKKADNVNPLVSVLYTFLLAPPILLIFAIFNGDLYISYTVKPLTIIYLALAGIFYLAIGRIFAYSSINLVGAARASQLTSTQIIFSSILSVIFLQEQMSLQLAIGTVTIFLGLLLISFSNTKCEGQDVIPHNRFNRGVLLGLIAGVLWGASQLFLKEGGRGLNSSTMASLISYLFAILIQGTIVFSFARREFKREKMQAVFLFSAGIVSTFALLAQYSALRIADVVWVNPIVNTSPLITLIACYLLIQKIESINKKVVFGALAVVAGAVLVAI